MAGDSQSSVKFVCHLPTKIDVMKFDVTNKFKMQRCEVMDALMASNLEDSLSMDKSQRRILKNLGQDESDGMWCH